MFPTGKNPFDPAALAEMFAGGDMAKMFDASAMKGVDPAAMMAAQKENLAALTRAQQSAVAGYKDLFEKQVAVFQETLSAAQAQIADLTKTTDPAEAAQKQTEMAQAAYQTAAANAAELAELAQKANTEAFEIMRARIEQSIADLTKG